MDALQKPTTQDKKIAAMISEHRKGCLMLVNKWDLEETTQRQYAPEVQRALPFMGYCPVLFVSAKSGYNIIKVAFSSYRFICISKLDIKPLSFRYISLMY